MLTHMQGTTQAKRISALNNLFSPSESMRHTLSSLMEWPLERLLLFHRLNLPQGLPATIDLFRRHHEKDRGYFFGLVIRHRFFIYL